MDIINNLSEEQYCERQRKAAAGLGFKLITPINMDDYPAERFNKLWPLLDSQEYMFDDFSKGNLQGFVEGMIKPFTFNFELGNLQGWATLRNAFEGSSTELHYAIWDKAFNVTSTVAAGREICDFAFQKVGVHRITGLIPQHNKTAQKLATLMGFRFEGEMKQAFKQNNKYQGLCIWGFTVDEWARRYNVRRINHNHN